MSLFGTSPTSDHNEDAISTPRRTKNKGSNGSNTGDGGGGGLFADSPPQRASSSGLFANDADDADDSSPWAMPTPRKQQSRADVVRNLLPTGDVPDSYIETFDTVVRQDGSGGRVTAAGVSSVFATARLEPEAQTRIMSLLGSEQEGSEITLGRGEFNVFLALVGLAQEKETISLDGVDERRRSESTFHNQLQFCYIARTPCSRHGYPCCYLGELLDQWFGVTIAAKISLGQAIQWELHCSFTCRTILGSVQSVESPSPFQCLLGWLGPGGLIGRNSAASLQLLGNSKSSTTKSPIASDSGDTFNSHLSYHLPIPFPVATRKLTSQKIFNYRSSSPEACWTHCRTISSSSSDRTICRITANTAPRRAATPIPNSDSFTTKTELRHTTSDDESGGRSLEYTGSSQRSCSQ